MSTDVQPAVPEPLGDGDPWRYGERYLRKIGPDGKEFVDVVPLRYEDLLHPEENDFHVTSNDHHRDLYYLEYAFHKALADRPGLRVLVDHRIDWQAAGISAQGPD